MACRRHGLAAAALGQAIFKLVFALALTLRGEPPPGRRNQLPMKPAPRARLPTKPAKEKTSSGEPDFHKRWIRLPAKGYNRLPMLEGTKGWPNWADEAN